MDEIAESNLETMIEICKERKTNMDFVNSEKMLKSVKEEGEEPKKEIRARIVYLKEDKELERHMR